MVGKLENFLIYYLDSFKSHHVNGYALINITDKDLEVK